MSAGEKPRNPAFCCINFHTDFRFSMWMQCESNAHS